MDKFINKVIQGDCLIKLKELEDNRKRHKGSGERYIDIARKLEYGNFKVPARPLFRIVFYYMSKNVSYFYNKYMEERL